MLNGLEKSVKRHYFKKHVILHVKYLQIKSVNDQDHFHGALRTLHASRGV